MISFVYDNDMTITKDFTPLKSKYSETLTLSLGESLLQKEKVG